MRCVIPVLLLVSIGCQEYAVTTQRQERGAVPDAPDSPDFGFGDPPDWSSCSAGWIGDYTNLAVGDEAVDATAPRDPRAVDWWDTRTFQDFHADLDFGTNWWPVDEGLAGDPEHFAVRWRTWMRVYDGEALEVLLGASGDAWVLVDEEVRVWTFDEAFTPEVAPIPIEPGQVPVEVRYLHTGGDSAFRFRVVGGEVETCYPDFD